MNLPYIQSELFRELVGIETLLKPEYGLLIIKSSRGGLKCLLVKKHAPFTHWWRYEYHLNPFAIKTQSDITAEINRIWDKLPAVCKKENILK